MATAEELLQEIELLVKEYFLATYEEFGNAFIMSIPNGQRFSVKVEEVK